MPSFNDIANGIATTAHTIAAEHASGEWERAAWRVRALQEMVEQLSERLLTDAVHADASEDTLARAGVAVAEVPRAVAEELADDDAFGELVTAAGEHAPGVVQHMVEQVCRTGHGQAELLDQDHPARLVAGEITAMLAEIQPS